MTQLCYICAALAGNSSAPSPSVAGDRHKRSTPENGSVHGSHPQNGMLDGNNTLQSSRNDAWKAWTLGKGGLSDFEGCLFILFFYSLS
jgi:hypothetical protein